MTDRPKCSQCGMETRYCGCPVPMPQEQPNEVPTLANDVRYVEPLPIACVDTEPLLTGYCDTMDPLIAFLRHLAEAGVACWKYDLMRQSDGSWQLTATLR